MSHLTEESLWALAAGEEADPTSCLHLAECDPCQARVEHLRRTRALARLSRPPEPSPSQSAAALARFEASLREEEYRSRAWMDRRPLILPALGLSALAGAALALLVGNTTQEPPAWGGTVVSHGPVTPVATAPVQPVPPSPRPPPVVALQEPPPAPVVPAKARREVPRVVTAPLPAVRPVVADAPEVVPVVTPPAAVPYPRVEAVKLALKKGETLTALRLALGLLSSPDAGEVEHALSLSRDAVFTQPTPEALAAVEAAAADHALVRGDLMHLACEAAVLARRPAEAVKRCRAFARAFPDTPRARDASYIAGTLARGELGDCPGAVEDYSHALLFAGPHMGSLNDDALFWRAVCQAKLGNTADARADLDQFLARYPSRRVDPQVRALTEKLAPR
jgi:tetratricopeptide (TPR) repeat protein